MSKNKKISRLSEIRNISLMIAITFIVGLILVGYYYTREINNYMKYSENSEIDYKVLLKDNDFFQDKYREQDKSYIASLIDTISSNFKYRITFSDSINYNYSYKIIADIDVEDKKNNSNIYHFSEDLATKNLTKNDKDLYIDENVDINYDHYNNIISKFKEMYQLDNIDSSLSISLIVSIRDIDRSKTTDFIERKVSVLKVPLTKNTVSVNIKNDTIDKTNKIELVKEDTYHWALVIGISYFIISILYVIYLSLYMKKTRTAQMIYEKEIKSIMNNYDSYIQKISGSYDIGTSQVIKIETFTDMLEIRDTLKQPILMLENKEKNGSFFIIPATNSIIYTYALRVVDIKAKMDGKEIPTYDITEISQKDFMKNKKYTEKYIKEQITMTSAIPQVDEKNIIKGNKDKDRDLYNQLEMTSSFDIKEIKKAAKKATKTTKKKTSEKKR